MLVQKLTFDLGTLFLYVRLSWLQQWSCQKKPYHECCSIRCLRKCFSDLRMMGSFYTTILESIELLQSCITAACSFLRKHLQKFKTKFACQIFYGMISPLGTGAKPRPLHNSSYTQKANREGSTETHKHLWKSTRRSIWKMKRKL